MKVKMATILGRISTLALLSIITGCHSLIREIRQPISHRQRCCRSTSPLYTSASEPERRRERQPRPTADRPTQTMFDSMGPKSIPAKPKIVVLGATGRIGRQVVKQLLQMKGVDMTVVAFCRDYEKALKVLYDDKLVVSRGDETNLNSNSNHKRGPKLQIIEGDLVPEEELPGYGRRRRRLGVSRLWKIISWKDDYEHDDRDDDEEEVWLKKAESAARFYGTKVEDYDNRELLPDINESLEEAVRDATTIISVVGSVRTTNIWTDFLARPIVRLLRPDVSSWCRDGHHPFYVHYMSTRKALGFAEREQLRREAAAVTMAEAEGLDLDKDLFVPRIRFIRVSDLNVAQNPWNLIPLMTNIVHSVTLRSQEMAERLLDDSTLVETVVIRPGDLIDDERDVKTTAIQVSSSGSVPDPSRIGRDDVASLVVEAAIMITPNETSATEGPSTPFHYTFATRWVGQDMAPYPPQGRKRDGHEDPSIAFQKAVKAARRADRAAKRKDRLRDHHMNSLILRGRNGIVGKTYGESSWETVKIMAKSLEERQRQRIKNRRSKPHGVCVAIVVYAILGWVLKKLLPESLLMLPESSDWLAPATNRMCQWMIIVFARILCIFPQKKATSYISF